MCIVKPALDLSLVRLEARATIGLLRGAGEVCPARQLECLRGSQELVKGGFPFQ